MEKEDNKIIEEEKDDDIFVGKDCKKFESLKLRGNYCMQNDRKINDGDFSFIILIKLLVVKFIKAHPNDIFIKIGKKYIFITKEEADKTFKKYEIINHENIIKNRDALKELMNCLVDDLIDNSIN
jgi:hypothetical protein